MCVQNLELLKLFPDAVPTTILVAFFMQQTHQYCFVIICGILWTPTTHIYRQQMELYCVSKNALSCYCDNNFVKS